MVACIRFGIPQEPFPEKAQGYGRALIELIRQAWMAYASVVDEVGLDEPTAGVMLRVTGGNRSAQHGRPDKPEELCSSNVTWRSESEIEP